LALHFNLREETGTNTNVSVDSIARLVVLYDGEIRGQPTVAAATIEREDSFVFTHQGPQGLSGVQIALEGGQYAGFDWTPEIARSGTFNLDWKGRYIDDPLTGVRESSRTVSFSGPDARFFGTEGFGQGILVEGRYYYATPLNVLGAAIQVDNSSKEFVVAVLRDSENQVEKLVRKPFLRLTNRSETIVQKGTAAKTLSGVADWELVGNITFGNNYPQIGGELLVSPWFFSGDGRKASTLREKIVELYLGTPTKGVVR